LKHHGKQKKTLKAVNASKPSLHLLGPKAFPLDRLLAIYYSIAESGGGQEVGNSCRGSTSNVLGQVASLVTLQFLAQIR